MLYCEKCRALVDNRCEKTGHATRSVREQDPVLVFKGDPIQAGQLEEMLRDQDIPYLKEGLLGAGMTTWAGPMMELFSFYVPYSRLEAAEELAMVLRPAEENRETDTEDLQ